MSGLQQELALKKDIVSAHQYTSDLAVEASKLAINAAGIDANKIDLIILATTTPDKTFPSTACIVQTKLGLSLCPAFDIQAVCSGFVYALSVADNFIKTGAAKCVLVIGADTMSRITDYSDRSNAILWVMEGVLLFLNHQINQEFCLPIFMQMVHMKNYFMYQAAYLIRKEKLQLKCKGIKYLKSL